MDSQEIIKIEGLTKTYGSGANKKEVLKGINLSIKSGNLIGYIGPNGAGKSTTIKILCGIITDFGGKISMFGKEFTSHDIELKHRIGYIPENGKVYDSLTPMEYAEFLADIYGLDPIKTKTKVEQLFDLFELKNEVNNRMDSFSKGMKQKALIINGLVHNPDILFLDEPLSGLDANSVIMVKEMLIHLKNEGKTIFYSSHLMDIVERISDRIILINNGIVIADGTFDEMKDGNNKSLEQLFSELTGKTDNEQKSQSILNIFNS
jgi:ABC-2 type transport system ATP-binding protein